MYTTDLQDSCPRHMISVRTTDALPMSREAPALPRFSWSGVGAGEKEKKMQKYS